MKNNGIVPKYYFERNHEAIIPKDIFLRVQEELVHRRVVKTSANGKRRSYSCNHCFAQIIVCGDCGEMFRSIAKVIREAQKTYADGIDEQLMELLKKANNKETYDIIADQIFKLREQFEKYTVDTASRDAQIERIKDLQDFIKK